MRVWVSGSNYPRFELNAHTGVDRYRAEEAARVECTIYHDAARATTLAVPVLG